jgi:hypothetical protein
MIYGGAALLLPGILGGCCWWAKRDCFPACPPTPPATVVSVEKSCDLPPTLKLPGVKRVEEGCGEGLICYTVPEAAKLALRQAKMKTWIKEVRTRCGSRVPPPDTSGPSSQPTSRPAP